MATTKKTKKNNNASVLMKTLGIRGAMTGGNKAMTKRTRRRWKLDVSWCLFDICRFVSY